VRRSRGWPLALLCLMASSGAAADELAEFHCIGFATGPDGKVQKALDDVRVLEPDRGPAPFAMVLPDGFKDGSVMCGRSDIVPDATDWKVLAAGYTLAITTGNGTLAGVLEAPGGHVGFRFLAGKPTPAQIDAIGARIDAFQKTLEDVFHPLPK
jgi:hypothetical protein